MPSEPRDPRPKRTLWERLKCALGFHDYGEPQVMKTALILSGERNDDGTWDREVDENPDPNRRVVQHCQRRGCWGDRERDDLDPEEVSNR